MDDRNLTSASSPSSILKAVCSPSTALTANNNNNKQRNDSASVIQQSDVSSSRPALLAHDVLGPLLFEALDGFFFTINHNCELDFVSDNVGQYLKFSQEELAGRNLYCCVHPSDVSEFSKAWAKKDVAGDSLTPTALTDQPRGRTFLCRMRTNDEAAPYITMVVSVALHRDSSGSDKTFLICIARRPPVNEFKDKPALLGFDQFSSRINLQYDIESLDSSHIKCETIDMNFLGRNFRDYVFVNDIPLVNRHFQEVVENGESKSAVYRFCLHDDIYAFVNTQSKLSSNSTTGKSDSIISTHTIVRLIDNPHDLHGNASTRLMKSIIISNRDLQKNKQQSSSASSASKIITTPPPPPPPQTSTPPIGTQFALTMLGMHKNASNSLQQHVTSTLGTLIQVQNSLSTSSPIDKVQQQFSVPSPPRAVTQKSSTLDNVSSSDSVEFGSKRTAFSPSFNSVHSNHGSIPSPTTSFDLSFTSVSPTNDLSFLLPNCSPSMKKSSSPLQLLDPTSLLFSNHDIYTTSSSPRTTTPVPSLQSRNSTRLRQLLANKSPSSPSPNQYETKTHLTAFDEYVQVAESPTTTHVSPIPPDQPSPAKRRRNLSQTNGTLNHSADILLKQILGRQAPLTNMTSLPNASDALVHESHSGWPSPASVPSIKSESNNNHDDSMPGGMAGNSSGNTSKLRSDIFLRTLLNDEVRPQKVVVEAPFTYNSRHKYNQRASAGANLLLGVNHNKSLGNNNSRGSFKSQLSLQTVNSFEWDPRSKKKQRQHSHTFGVRPNVMTTISSPRKPGRPKRDPTDYLLSNPQSTLSENSLDSLLESSAINPDQSSPIALRRTARQTSSTNANAKRTIDNDDPLFTPRKYPKLLTQALKDDIKIECTDHSIISTSVALAATRPLVQSSQTIIKTEPEIPFLFDKTTSPSLKRTINHTPTSSSQSTLLRSLIRTPHTAPITTKKDAPLYDLLQDLDSNDTSIFSSLNSTSTASANEKHSIDPLEQYLTPVLTQPIQASKTSSSKDNYLATLLSSDPQEPNEISFIPNSTQQQTPARSSSASSDNSRIAAIVNDLFASTVAATNNSSDDILSLLDNKDFLECISGSTTIDSILGTNSTSAMETSIPSTTSKRSEKDEKAISEIYKTLVTSFNPGSSSSLDLPVDHSPFSSITGDFLFAENSTMSLPPNRTATADPSMLMYRQQQQQQQPTTYSYQTTQQQQSSNSAQFPDCLGMDMIDNNTFPPNVSLSPMNNSYLSSSTIATSHMETNSMMMHTQQAPPTHIQHHQPQNSMSNLFYRQSTQPQQQQQQPMYNNYGQPPPNQVAPGYYSMPQQPSQQRMPPNHHPSQLTKRQPLMHQQRTPQQNNNQQLQLHMSMNVTLPHMAQNQQQQQLLPQQSQRPMMNTYNDLLMPNGNSSSLQQDFHRYSSANSANNNPLDLPYNHDLFLSPSSSSSSSSGLSTSQQQQVSQNRHINVMPSQQQQPSVPSSQATMHQSYSNMSVALSTTIQQNPNNPNNHMNSAGPNLTSAECRQSEELNNQMMNCLSFPPTRFTSEFVRKQLQNTIHGRQKPSGGKDIPAATGQKMMNSPNLDSNQKGAYFRNQLSSQMSTPTLQTNMRSQQQQQQQQPSKTSM